MVIQNIHLNVQALGLVYTYAARNPNVRAHIETEMGVSRCYKGVCVCVSAEGGRENGCQISGRVASYELTVIASLICGLPVFSHFAYPSASLLSSPIIPLFGHFPHTFKSVRQCHFPFLVIQ